MQTVNRVVNAPYVRKTADCPVCQPSKQVKRAAWRSHFQIHHPGMTIPDMDAVVIPPQSKVQPKSNGAVEHQQQEYVEVKPNPDIDVLDRFNQTVNQLVRSRDELTAEKKRLLERVARIEAALGILPNQPGGTFHLPDKPVA